MNRQLNLFLYLGKIAAKKRVLSQKRNKTAFLFYLYPGFYGSQGHALESRRGGFFHPVTSAPGKPEQPGRYTIMLMIIA